MVLHGESPRHPRPLRTRCSPSSVRRANARTGARADRSDDGILTAEEVAGLNLQGTEWVGSSACDTGTGQIKAGEGVFGLRRAFQIAGVRTIIMSLWSAEDRSTQIWMRSFCMMLVSTFSSRPQMR